MLKFHNISYLRPLTAPATLLHRRITEAMQNVQLSHYHLQRPCLNIAVMLSANVGYSCHLRFSCHLSVFVTHYSISTFFYQDELPRPDPTTWSQVSFLTLFTCARPPSSSFLLPIALSLAKYTAVPFRSSIL